MCGGPTSQQKAAATSTANLSNAELQQFQKGSAVTNPFFTNLVENPGQDPVLATQFGQQRAAQKGALAGFGDALPSGFATAADARSREAYGQAQDASALNRQVAGAQGLNPQQAANTTVAANQSIMQAPLQNSFWSNLIGGLVQGAGAAALA